jgi:NTE family protein
VTRDPKIADLVLEGGGVKGIGLVGAITVLEEHGYTFNRIAGTSAGSIVGALVAAGYTGVELREIMEELDYRRFRDGGVLDKLGILGKAAALVVEHGVYEGSYLKEWLRERLAEKNINTFGDCKVTDPDSRDVQDKLVVMASDVSQGCLRRLPWDYRHYSTDHGADGVQIIDAVRASMSIPFFYEPVKLKAKDGEESWLVDGGMLSNFPIDTFDRPGGNPRWPTFGIKLSARPTRSSAPNRVRGNISLVEAMVATMMGFHDQMHLEDPSVLARTIFVDTTGVGAIDFDLDKKTQLRLYNNGRSAAERFLDGDDTHPAWDWDAYVTKYRSRDQ